MYSNQPNILNIFLDCNEISFRSQSNSFIYIFYIVLDSLNRTLYDALRTECGVWAIVYGYEYGPHKSVHLYNVLKSRNHFHVRLFYA